MDEGDRSAKITPNNFGRCYEFRVSRGRGSGRPVIFKVDERILMILCPCAHARSRPPTFSVFSMEKLNAVDEFVLKGDCIVIGGLSRERKSKQERRHSMG